MRWMRIAAVSDVQLLHNMSSEPGEAQAFSPPLPSAACPTSTTLEQYYLGELASAQESVIAAHLRSDCPHCRATVAALMHYFADLGADAMVTPQAPVAEERTRSQAFPAFWARLKEQATTLRQQIVGRVTFVLDLVTMPAPTLALRGDGASLPLIYRHSDGHGDIEVRIDLQPELGTDRKVLVGQVKAPNLDLDGAEIQLRQAEAIVAGTTLTGKRGRFQLPSLPPGDYALVVRSAQWEIQIPNLHCP